MDRKRKGKKTSNKDWESPTDADARIVRLKDGRTRLGYKAEHVVDLETGAVVAAEMYSADDADTATLRSSLEAARENVAAVRAESNGEGSRDDDDDDAPPPAAPSGESRPNDRGRRGQGLSQGAIALRTRASRVSDVTSRCPIKRDNALSPTRAGCWRAKRFITIERACAARRERGCFGYAASESSEPSLWRARPERIAGCDCAAATMRKRYIAHVAALNLGLVMRTLFGHGTPRQAADAVLAALIMALRLVYEKIAGFGARLVGTLLPRPMARHPIAGLVA